MAYLKTIMVWARALRVGQWTKNLLIPAAWLFADVLLLALYRVELRRLERLWDAQAVLESRRKRLKRA